MALTSNSRAALFEPVCAICGAPLAVNTAGRWEHNTVGFYHHPPVPVRIGLDGSENPV